MGTLRTGKDRRRSRRISPARLFHLHLHSLAAAELHGRPPRVPATPILPEHWSCSNAQGMQQQAHPAWFFRGCPMPLTLLTEVTAATVADLGSEEHSQGAISFAAHFVGMQTLASRAAQAAIGLRNPRRARRNAQLSRASRPQGKHSRRCQQGFQTRLQWLAQTSAVRIGVGSS